MQLAIQERISSHITSSNSINKIEGKYFEFQSIDLINDSDN